MADYNDALNQLKALAAKKNNVIEESEFENIAEECENTPEDMERISAELTKAGIRV